MSTSAQPTSNSQPTPEQELDQIDIDMQAAEQKAILAQSHYDAWKAAENAALIAVYDVWKDKEHRTDLLEPFCKRHSVPWHGSFNNNRFLPIVKKMFPHRTIENHSEYSGVMAYAWENQTPPQDLPDFIEQNGGVQKTYRAYTAIKKARKQIKKNPSANLVQAPTLDNLYNAIRLMLRLTYRGKVNAAGELKEARQFLIRNEIDDVGNQEGVIETITTAYTAPAARMMLDQPIKELQGRAYLLDDKSAQLFVDIYPQERGWTFTADAVEVVFKSVTGIMVKGGALSPNHPDRLRRLDKLSERTPYMQAPLDKIKGFDDWYQAISAAAERQWRLNNPFPTPNVTPMAASILSAVHANAFPRRPIPSVLDFNSWGDHVTVGFNRSMLIDGSALGYHVHDLFDTSHPVTVSRERGLLVKHAHKLFSVLVDEGMDGICFLANTDEEQGAFVCELSMDEGSLYIAYPTVMSASGDVRCILDDLPIQRLANTGLVIPQSSQAPYVHAGTTLRDQAFQKVAQQFGAFITSYRPPDEAKWKKRRAKFAEQLRVWLDEADVPLHLRLSGWNQADADAFNAEFNDVLGEVVEFNGAYQIVPGALLIHNRIECLKDFYASEFDWGIMMDDDAVLYDKAQHNSGWNFFPEMAENGPAAYPEVDVFFPNNPGKPGGGFGPKYREDPQLYAGNHVFDRNPDLKGSMFVVRNFRKAKRHEVLPDTNYLIHGEDTLFATEAIKQGCTVMKCWNINLKELVGERDSHFAQSRVKAMREAHMRIAEMYAADGLRMKNPDDEDSKTLERKDFYANCWKARPTKWSTPKP